MKKTKWTQDDFRDGEVFTITVQDGTDYFYRIIAVTATHIHVDCLATPMHTATASHTGELGYDQFDRCDYDFTFNDRIKPLQTFKIKEYL